MACNIYCNSSVDRSVPIELDDKSHRKKKAIFGDVKKNRIYKKVGLPILHVKVQRGYQKQILATEIVERIRGGG